MAAGAGTAAVGLWTAAALVTDLPPVHRPAGEIAAYFDDEHARIITSVYLTGSALACFLFFLAGLSTKLRNSGETELGAVAFGGGMILASVLAEATVVLGALAFRATDDASVAQGLFDLVPIASTFASFPLAALVAGTALAALRSGVFPAWHGWAGAVAAAGFLAAGATFAGRGFFSPDGAYARAAFVVFLAWVLATSGLLLRVVER